MTTTHRPGCPETGWNTNGTAILRCADCGATERLEDYMQRMAQMIHEETASMLAEVVREQEAVNRRLQAGIDKASRAVSGTRGA